MIDRLFKDKDGKWVIAQAPNWPIYLAIGAWIVGNFASSDIAIVAQYIKISALIYWSYLELFKGDAPWRRLLGAVVGYIMIVELIGLIN